MRDIILGLYSMGSHAQRYFLLLFAPIKMIVDKALWWCVPTRCQYCDSLGPSGCCLAWFGSARGSAFFPDSFGDKRCKSKLMRGVGSCCLLFLYTSFFDHAMKCRRVYLFCVVILSDAFYLFTPFFFSCFSRSSRNFVVYYEIAFF